MPDSNIDELFLRTLAQDYDSDDAWTAVRALHEIGSLEVFERAVEWCNTQDPLRRARGADVLAQLGKTANHPDALFASESYLVITELLRKQSDPVVLNSAIHALGHLGQIAAITQLVQFASNPNPDIRFAVTFAFGCYPNDERSVAALLTLMTDIDDDVRDWATFGVGSLSEQDSGEIRMALLRNLTDADEDVREEAMVGLAKRKDLRVLPAVRDALCSTCNSPRGKEAACFLLGSAPASEPADAAACLAELSRKFPQ